jgi:hypothetical protein
LIVQSDGTGLDKCGDSGGDSGDGTEKLNPAKVTERHDNGTRGAGRELSATARGEWVSVFTTLRAKGPSAVTSMPKAGA